MFFTESLMKQTFPSKRQVNKTKVRKGYNGQQSLEAVGGYRDPYKAIFAPAGTKLCKVVDNDRGRNEDGTPFRNVGPRSQTMNGYTAATEESE